MLPTEERKQQISLAYVRAVAGRAGYECTRPESDYGYDLTISHVAYLGKTYRSTGHLVNVQVKSTAAANFKDDDTLLFDLKAKNYNHLILSNVGNPAILIVYVLHSDAEEWLSVSQGSTTLKCCAYWISLRGMNETSNTATIRIEIPCSQIFDVSELDAIMSRVRSGGLP